MNDSVSDFGLGETIKGQNDDSVDINTALDGREYTFPVSAAVATAAGMHNRTVGRRVTARILRNKTGGTLAAGDLFYGIVRGPSKVRQGATAVVLTAGDAIKAGAAGVVADATLSTDHGLILGTTLKASTTPADDGLLVEVELAPEWV